MSTAAAAGDRTPAVVGARRILPPLGPEARGDAEQRVLRIIYVSIGIGGVVYLGVGASKAIAQYSAFEPAPFVVMYLLAAIGPFVILGLSVRGSLASLRIAAFWYAIAFWAVMLAFRPFMTASMLPDGNSPWTNDLMSIPAIALAIGTRRSLVWAYVVGTAVTSGVIRYLADPELGVTIALLDLVYNLFFSSVFVAITQVTRSSAIRLDGAADAARAKTAKEAEASARVQQRIRIDALVHDHVLSALLIASRADAVPTPALRELAATTLRTLAEDALPPHELLTRDDFVGRLRSSVTSQATGIAFDSAVGPELRVPADIAQALLEATSEAVRNSLAHAGSGTAGSGGVARSVTVTAAGHGVRIVVSDNGKGFNSRRIPPERLGVRVSILNRMATLDGGRADIDSSRGYGTRVTLGWAPEEAA